MDAGRSAPFNASQRAITDISVRTDPNGLCPVLKDPPNTSFAIVQERNVAYVLKKACLAIPTSSVRLNTMNTTLPQLTATFKQSDNLNKLLLLQPLFVEFSLQQQPVNVQGAVNTGNINQSPLASVAYVPVYSFTPSNSRPLYSTRAPVTDKTDVSFVLIGRTTNGSCDPAFDYTRLAKTNVVLTPTMVNNHLINKTNGHIHITAYYLDPLSDSSNASFQTTGLSMLFPPPAISTSINNNNSTSTTVALFDTNYKSLSNDPSRINMYEFMNKLALMYYNFIPPVLTFEFDLTITPDVFNYGTSSLPALNCNIDIPFDRYQAMSSGQPCPLYNLWGLDVRSDARGVILSLNTDDGSGNCRSLVNAPAPPTSVLIPYKATDGNIVVNVIATIAPNQKHLVAKWRDPQYTANKQFVFHSATAPYTRLPFDVCRQESGWSSDNSPRETCIMTKVFSSKNLSPRPPLGNIVLSWKPILSKMTKVTIGCLNLLDNV